MIGKKHTTSQSIPPDETKMLVSENFRRGLTSKSMVVLLTDLFEDTVAMDFMKKHENLIVLIEQNFVTLVLTMANKHQRLIAILGILFGRLGVYDTDFEWAFAMAAYFMDQELSAYELATIVVALVDMFRKAVDVNYSPEVAKATITVKTQKPLLDSELLAGLIKCIHPSAASENLLFRTFVDAYVTIVHKIKLTDLSMRLTSAICNYATGVGDNDLHSKVAHLLSHVIFEAWMMVLFVGRTQNQNHDHDDFDEYFESFSESDKAIYKSYENTPHLHDLTTLLSKYNSVSSLAPFVFSCLFDLPDPRKRMAFYVLSEIFVVDQLMIKDHHKELIVAMFEDSNASQKIFAFGNYMTKPLNSPTFKKIRPILLESYLITREQLERTSTEHEKSDLAQPYVNLFENIQNILIEFDAAFLHSFHDALQKILEYFFAHSSTFLRGFIEASIHHMYPTSDEYREILAQMLVDQKSAGPLAEAISLTKEIIDSAKMTVVNPVKMFDPFVQLIRISEHHNRNARTPTEHSADALRIFIGFKNVLPPHCFSPLDREMPQRRQYLRTARCFMEHPNHSKPTDTTYGGPLLALYLEKFAGLAGNDDAKLLDEMNQVKKEIENSTAKSLVVTSLKKYGLNIKKTELIDFIVAYVEEIHKILEIPKVLVEALASFLHTTVSSIYPNRSDSLSSLAIILSRRDTWKPLDQIRVSDEDFVKVFFRSLFDLKGCQALAVKFEKDNTQCFVKNFRAFVSRTSPLKNKCMYNSIVEIKADQVSQAMKRFILEVFKTKGQYQEGNENERITSIITESILQDAIFTIHDDKSLSKMIEVSARFLLSLPGNILRIPELTVQACASADLSTKVLFYETVFKNL